MEVEETLLPGVGVRFELRIRSGQVLAIVVSREGGAEIAVYDRHDPDRATGLLRLDAEALFDRGDRARLRRRDLPRSGRRAAGR